MAQQNNVMLMETAPEPEISLLDIIDNVLTAGVVIHGSIVITSDFLLAKAPPSDRYPDCRACILSAVRCRLPTLAVNVSCRPCDR